MEQICLELMGFLKNQFPDCINTCTKPSSDSQQISIHNLQVFLAGLYYSPKYLLLSLTN